MKLSENDKTKIRTKLYKNLNYKNLLVEVSEDGSIFFYETKDSSGNIVNHKKILKDKREAKILAREERREDKNIAREERKEAKNIAREERKEDKIKKV